MHLTLGDAESLCSVLVSAHPAISRVRSKSDMLLSQIHVSPKYTVDDVVTQRADAVDVLEDQVEGWIFQPADTLRLIGTEVNAEHHNAIAILALELLFFEPHGQLLRGTDEKGSAATFKTGFNEYKRYLSAADSSQRGEFVYQDFSAKKLYELGRCGLFHSAQLKYGLLVHPEVQGTLAFRYEPGVQAWIINPWPLLDSLRAYFKQYLADLRTSPLSAKRRAFDKIMSDSFHSKVNSYHVQAGALANLRYPLTDPISDNP
jgi:hypothetical protein